MKLKEQKKESPIEEPIQEPAKENKEKLDVSRRECTLSKKMQELLLRQLVSEMYNHNLYLSFANYYGVRGFSKLEEYYVARANEEKTHYSWIYYWLNYNDVEFIHPEVPAIKEEWDTMEKPFDLTVDKEIATTQDIYEMVDLAWEERDYNTYKWLMADDPKTGALVAEQAEEESLSRTVRDMANSDASWLRKENSILEFYKNH